MNQEIWMVRFGEPQVVVGGIVYSEVQGPFASREEAIEWAKGKGMSVWRIMEEVDGVSITLEVSTR